mgnify:CR=1 FL=1
MISAVILTFNEEIHIERCIRSVQKVCSEVWVVDSCSSDRTCEIAKQLGANVTQHKFENQARQFNWAIDNLPIETEWIWRVDADEIIEDGLAELVLNEVKSEMLKVKSDPSEQVNGIYVNKKIVFMGRPLLHGGWYPAQQIKIIRKGFGRSEDKMMDEHLIVTEGKTISVDGDQTDWNLKPLDWWWEKHKQYAVREAKQQMLMRNADLGMKVEAEVKGKLFGTNTEFKRYMKNLYGHCPRYARAVVYFISRYFFMLGFLDGYTGWYWHTRQGLIYRWMVDREIGKLRKL